MNNILAKSFAGITTTFILTLSLLTGCQADTNQVDTIEPTKKIEKTSAPLVVAAVSPATTPATRSKPNFVEGVHYVSIYPELPNYAEEGKVSVTELFWYGCPHCYDLEPTIDKFLAKKPAFIQFFRVPATLNSQWSFHAKAYYIGQLLDPTEKKGFHKKVFYAILKQRRNLYSEDAVRRYFMQLGVSEYEYNRASKSQKLKTKLEQADVVSYGSQADSVPTIIVNGKYRTTVGMAKGYDNLILLIHHLARMEKK